MIRVSALRESSRPLQLRLGLQQSSIQVKAAMWTWAFGSELWFSVSSAYRLAKKLSAIALLQE